MFENYIDYMESIELSPPTAPDQPHSSVVDTFEEMEARCPIQYQTPVTPPPLDTEPVISLEPLTITDRTKRFPVETRRAIVFCRANSGKHGRAVVLYVRRVVGG
jgi:hypothetical protein